jgi:hypothetical protein
MSIAISNNDVEAARISFADIEKGERIGGIIRGVSASGLTHYVSLAYPSGKGDLRHLTWSIGILTGHKVVNYNGYNAIKMQGGGYDKVFQLVYELGISLHNDGYHYRSYLI